MKLSDTMTMLDVIKLIKEIAGDDDSMRDDIRTSLYNMADTDDIADESVEDWIKAYPEDKQDKLRTLFAGPAVEVTKTKIEGGKNQPPEDAEDDELVAQMLEQLVNSDKEPAASEGGEEPDTSTSEEPAASEGGEEPDTSTSEEPAASNEEPEEQDETTRNILAGLSNK